MRRVRRLKYWDVRLPPFDSKPSAGRRERKGRAAVNGSKVVARIGAVGLAAGTVIAPSAGPAHTELTLLSAEDPLDGSETAIILGATTQPTPSVEYARTVEDLFLDPLGFDGGAADPTVVCYMDGTDPCSAPLQVLTTPELIPQSHSTFTAASDIVLAVENAFAANPEAFSAEEPLTVFGYSQSAAAESIAMSRLADAGIPTDSVYFVSIGNPTTPDGMWPNLDVIEDAMNAMLGPDLTDFLFDLFDLDGLRNLVIPDDLYGATVYSLEADPVTNFLEVFESEGLWDALLGILGPHVEYLGLTPEQIADATTTVDGEVTYIDISGDINDFDAWLTAVFENGAANSGLLESVFDSVQFILDGVF